MIISRRDYEAALEKAKEEIRQQNTLEKEISRLYAHIEELKQQMFDLRCSMQKHACEKPVGPTRRGE